VEHHIRFELRDGIATITLDRAEKMNAFAGSMREDLLRAIEAAVVDPAARVLVITGAGRAFCAGGDIDNMARLKSEGAPFDEIEALMGAGAAVVRALQAFDRPTLAAVNGPAAGAGLGLALACDLRLAADTATFGATFSRIGLHPDWGCSWSLPRLVGPSRALRMIWTGEVIDAAHAARIGLVDQLVPTGDFQNSVAALAKRLAAAPPVAVARAKQAIERSARATLEEMLAFEVEAQRAAWESSDSGEGIAAFVEKRPPRFGRGDHR
jgi:enoyl-CoA hydratase/carnithine racemase